MGARAIRVAAAGIVIGVLLVMSSVLISGWGRPSGPPAIGAGQPADARAVRQLTAGAAGIITPPGFSQRQGYRPGSDLINGQRRAARRDGGCSSVLGGTLWNFTPACRSHDLGYDLLRDAADQHRPLPTAARRAIDDNFGRQLRARCREVRDPFGFNGCQQMATIYIGVVEVNSWRQGWGVPVVEHPGPLLPATTVGWLFSGALLRLIRRSPRDLVVRRIGRRNTPLNPVEEWA